MRFTTYSKYKGKWLDALNLESLLEHLSDFLMDGGFAGGPHYHPFWGWSGDEDTNSTDSLKNQLLRALVESGQLTPEMIEELRGEGEGDEEIQQKIAELLDDLVQRMVEEGYIDHLGVFPWSREDGTPSALRPLRVEPERAEVRASELMAVQAELRASAHADMARRGDILEVFDAQLLLRPCMYVCVDG